MRAMADDEISSKSAEDEVQALIWGNCFWKDSFPFRSIYKLTFTAESEAIVYQAPGVIPGGPFFILLQQIKNGSCSRANGR